VVFVASLLSGSVLVGAVIGGLFGGVRASSVLLASTVRDQAQLDAFDAKLRALAPTAVRATFVFQAFAVVSIALVILYG
jgi:hypothetical protein